MICSQYPTCAQLLCGVSKREKTASPVRSQANDSISRLYIPHEAWHAFSHPPGSSREQQNIKTLCIERALSWQSTTTTASQPPLSFYVISFFPFSLLSFFLFTSDLLLCPPRPLFSHPDEKSRCFLISNFNLFLFFTGSPPIMWESPFPTVFFSSTGACGMGLSISCLQMTLVPLCW